MDRTPFEVVMGHVQRSAAKTGTLQGHRIDDDINATFEKMIAKILGDASTGDRLNGNLQRGTTSSNALVGSENNDTLKGGEGNDRLDGQGGDDLLFGGGGNDVLFGGFGNDKLYGGAGADRLDGGIDHPVLSPDSYGWDTASYYGATSGVGVYLWDTLRNTGDAAGDMYISIEVIDGSTHGDTLEGSNGVDTFWADAGDDLLKGWASNDVLKGAAGNDRLYGGTGADTLDGGADLDLALYADASAGVLVDLLYTNRNTGEAAGDVYVSIEGLVGSSHDDHLAGTADQDSLYGGAGNDVLEGRKGGDRLDGGEGFDFVSYWSASSGVIASVWSGSNEGAGTAGDRFYSIEGLQGSNYGDLLYGDGGGNTLYGWGGNDGLHGLAGNDYIEGGSGDDTVSGGEGLDWLLGNAGADQFRFDTNPWAGGTSDSPQNVDTLADFNVAEGDRIALNTNQFWGIDTSGRPFSAFPAIPDGIYASLSSNSFIVGTHATSSSHRIIHDQNTGSIYFDADGSGGVNGQIMFAKVAAGTALTAAQFQLFTL